MAALEELLLLLLLPSVVLINVHLWLLTLAGLKWSFNVGLRDNYFFLIVSNFCVMSFFKKLL